MGGITAHTTTANYQRLPRYRYVPGGVVNYAPQTPQMQAVPIDEGVIDYGSFLAELRAGGFTGGVAYEMCSPLREGGSLTNLDRYARRFVEFLSRFRQETAGSAVDGNDAHRYSTGRAKSISRRAMKRRQCQQCAGRYCHPRAHEIPVTSGTSRTCDLNLPRVGRVWV